MLSMMRKPYLVFSCIYFIVMIPDISFFLNRYDDAIQLYDRILQEDPTNTVSLYVVLKVT